ncbi:hypothetical protein MYX75_02075 [Acidobacteria bacterium AH-259-A15]|nr:hypothetical protein [Acidobacteria bacterium AH-259-A15]
MDQDSPNFGNSLNRILQTSIARLFAQGEFAQLTHYSFDHTVRMIRNSELATWKLDLPVGYSPQKRTMTSRREYKKEELIDRYEFLANELLAINGIYQLVIVVEAMLGDVIRALVLKYPKKLGTKRQIPAGVVLSASSIEEIHLHTIDSLLNDLSYKSPQDYAVAVEELISVRLLECPSFHRYVEIKATRDVHIHNRGLANEVYARKVGSHARVNPGRLLPVDTIYFLESYEHCIKLAEWLQEKLHDKWPSSEFEERKKQQR